MNMKQHIAFGLSLLLPLAASAQVPEYTVDPNKVIATVNGEAIKSSELYSRLEYLDLAEVAERFGNRVLSFPAGFLALDQIVLERLTLQLAKERNVTPTNPEVQAHIASRLAELPNALTEWEAAGRTKEQFEYHARIELARFKLLTAGITLTDLEVEKFYNDNPTMFTSEKRFKLRGVVLKDPQKKAAVDRDIQSGRPFAEIAKTYSEDVSRFEGGALGEIPVSAMADPILKAIEAVKIGQYTDWIEFGGLHSKFLVEDILPASVRALDAKLKESIRRKLMIDRGQVKNDVAKQLADFRAKSKIEVSHPYFTKPWNEFHGGAQGSAPPPR